MTAKDLEKKVFEKAKEFGLLTLNMKNESNSNKTVNAVQRSNIESYNDAKSKCYFGFIRPEESQQGAYYDLSFVIFPQENDGKCVVSIGVGSAGFQRDFDEVSRPGTRRVFTRLAKPDGNSFIKNDFTDIETPLKELQDKVDSEIPGLSSVIKYYNIEKKVLLASRIVNPDTEFDVITAWLAQYAKLRNWATNNEQRKKQNDAIKPHLNKSVQNVQRDIYDLLNTHKYVVLQGAPGTGKTFNALKFSKVNKNLYVKTHFIQFHAETTYTDFVEGIRPKLDNKDLVYTKEKGELVKAISSAKKLEGTGKRVLLIIDEINRANLANVLGPVFYLFEKHIDEREVELEVGDFSLSKLPENLYVIATMNTADRSLAVVDFALRRRFIWYTIRPQKINTDKQKFHDDYFNRFCDIFDCYASDEELNLQPGPSYFLTSLGSDEEMEKKMKERMIYELMPLIKEYLAEGLMKKATDSFAQLFYEKTGKYLYE